MTGTMNARLTSVVLLAGMLLVLPVGAAAVHAASMEGIAYWWSEELSGSVSGNVSGATGDGTLADDDSDRIGFEFSTSVLGGLQVGYLPLSHTTVVSGTFSFNGTTFPSGGTLDYDLDIMELFKKFRVGKIGGNKFSFLAGVKWLQIDATISDGINTSTFDEDVPLPQIGFSTQLSLGRGMKLEGEFKIFDLEVNDVDAKFYDYKIGVSYHTEGNLDMVAGYRKLSIDATDNPGTSDEATLDIDHAGPYFGVRIVF